MALDKDMCTVLLYIVSAKQQQETDMRDETIDYYFPPCDECGGRINSDCSCLPNDWETYKPSGDELMPGEQDAHDAWVAEGKPRCGERG